MDMIYIMLPGAILLALIGVAAFVWAVRSGQFEDVETPAVRILFDEENQTPKKVDQEEVKNSVQSDQSVSKL